MDDAKIKLKERQCTFSKKKCIEKYGLEEGLKKLKERNKKWQDSLKSREDYVEIIIKRQNKKGYSQISQFLFKELEEKIKDLNLKVYYAEKNHEWGIGVKDRGGFLYDFVIPEIKYALEFNGERWHPRKEMNEKEWNEWQNPYTKENADEVYKKDLYKNKILEDRGFIVDIVWYKDYIKNKEEIIKNSYLNIINCYEKYK